MEDLLFLVHRIPYPPNKGDKIRSWNILKHLAERFRVHLCCFVDDPEDHVYEPEIRRICDQCLFVPLNPRFARLASLRYLATGLPLSLGYFRSPAISRWIAELTTRRQIGQVFVYSSSMAQYAIQPRLGPGRLVVDFVDVDSDKWLQYAARKSWPASLIFAREARTLLAFDRRVAQAADANLFVSEQEAELFRRLAPESASKILALNNGVDFDFFDPGGSYANPFAEARNVMVFTGQMDYWANVDAVVWFAREVFPRVRARVADAGFWIVGASPGADVRRLAAIPGVTVTGRVPDTRPYIAHAALVVAPLRVARGVQNKILEAMAMAKAVLATSQAADGLVSSPGRDIVIADEPESLAREAVRLLVDGDRHGLGRSARAKVVSDYGWASNLAGLNTILQGSRV